MLIMLEPFVQLARERQPGLGRYRCTLKLDTELGVERDANPVRFHVTHWMMPSAPARSPRSPPLSRQLRDYAPVRSTCKSKMWTQTEQLPEGARQLQTDEMLEVVIAGSELSILDITEEVLREDRVAFPEAIREVDAAAEAFLLRTGEVLHRAPDHGPVEVETQHQIWCEASGETPEIVPAVRADEVR